MTEYLKKCLDVLIKLGDKIGANNVGINKAERELEYLEKRDRDLTRMTKHIDRIIDAYKHLDNYSETIHVYNVVEDLERIQKNQG